MSDSKIIPAFPQNDNAIVFAADDAFCPYLATMLVSMFDHAKAENNYDIVVLNRNILPFRIKKMTEMAQGKKNISLRFYNVADRIDNIQLYTGGKENFTIDAYLRLLIPSVLSDQYTKALYLDGDMLALTDVAPLLQTDLNGFLLASSRDMGGIADYYFPVGTRKQYREKILPDENPDDYFISGMLVFNLVAFRKEFTQEDLLTLASSRNWLQHDQDVLNVICKGGRAKMLHASWDVLKPYKPEYLPAKLKVELEESVREPKILHFGGIEKPWKNTLSPWMDIFWETAVKTPFYKEMIYRILQENPGSINEVMLQRFKKGQVGFSYIIKFIKAWVLYKVKHGNKRTD